MIGGTVRKKHLLAAVSVPVFSTNSKPAIDPWEGRNSTLPKQICGEPHSWASKDPTIVDKRLVLFL